MQSVINFDILDYCCPKIKEAICTTFKINTVCFIINADYININ